MVRQRRLGCSVYQALYSVRSNMFTHLSPSIDRGQGRHSIRRLFLSIHPARGLAHGLPPMKVCCLNTPTFGRCSNYPVNGWVPGLAACVAGRFKALARWLAPAAGVCPGSPRRGSAQARRSGERRRKKSAAGSPACGCPSCSGRRRVAGTRLVSLEEWEWVSWPGRRLGS